jgi:NADH-quinone oxidoreductase subunit L
MLIVAWVGGITAIFAASIGLVMEDIKKVLAYSTVSQLGLMMVSLGVGGYTAGVFHLTTHAFFKALLFLAAGNVIHAVHTQNMHEMGGLRHKVPVTFWCWMVGAGALAGIPPLAGFWSKDEIMLATFHANPVLFWITVTAALFTAFYITRATLLTFFGKPRNEHAYNHSAESALTMTAPLVVLAALAAVAGLLNSPFTHYWFSRFVFFDKVHEAGTSTFVLSITTLSWMVGVAVAFAIYAKGWISREAIIGTLRPVWVVLKHKYYVDELYQFVFVKGTLRLARLTGWFDHTVIDGIVNRIGAAFSRGSQVVRRLQTGNVQTYAITMFLTIVVGLLVLVTR